MTRVTLTRRTSFLGALLAVALVPGLLLVPWQPGMEYAER